MIAAARPDRGWNGVTVTAAPRRGHGGHDAGHRSSMYRVSSRELHQRIKKKKRKNPVSGIGITFIAHSCSVLRRPFNLFFLFFFYFYDLRQILKVRSWMKSPRVADLRSDVHIPFTGEIRSRRRS